MFFFPQIYHIKHNGSRIGDITSVHSTCQPTTHKPSSANISKTVDEQTIHT